MFDNFHGKDHLLVAMTDQAATKRELIYINPDEIRKYNDLKYGIFFTVQGFKEHRRKENLTRINAWAVDLDEGTKQEQKLRIKNSKIPPSCVVESKNGFHVYWEAKDATEANFDRIEACLVESFNADRNAKDLCRLLRVPCTFHWKDENDPFLVKEVFRLKRTFTEKEMMEAFVPKETKKVFKTYVRSFDLEKVDCKRGLEQLSGTSVVNGDVYTFRPNGKGEQIWVNGKNTSCWLDENGKIGSHDKGGPTLLQWVQWYGYDKQSAMRILKDYE